MAVPRFHALPTTCFSLLFACLTCSAWAAPPSPESDLPLLTEADLLIDIPRIRSATRLLQQRSEAPASITVIDRQMIDASGALEIPDLFRLVPGFQAYHVNGHKFGVTAHGLGETHPGRLEVMVDGRSVYLPMLSTVDWRSLGLGLSDIDYIEVVRGSNVPTYGSNAFLGAINIITRAPFKDRGSRIAAVGGSQQTAKVELSHNDTLGNHGVRLSAGYLQSDGFGVGDDGQGSYVNLQTTATPSLIDTIDLQLGFSQGRAGIGDSFTKISNRDYDANYQTLAWTRDLDHAGELRLQFYHNYFKAEMAQSLLSESFGIPPSAFDTSMFPFPDEPSPQNLEQGSAERFDLELQHQLSLDDSLRAVWGAGVRLDRGQSALLFNRDTTIDETLWRLFGNLEWRTHKRLVWNLGAMTEHSDFVGTKTSPRLALNYQLNRQHSLRTSYTLAYRMPSLLEANQDSRLTHSNGTLLLWLRNTEPNLQAEQNRTLELGYLGSVPAFNLEIDLKLFHEEVDHGIGRVINASTETGLFNDLFDIKRTTNSNNRSWRSNGLETQLKLRPSQRLWLALQYAYQDLEGASSGAGGTSLNGMAPRHTLSLLASHRLPHGWDASLAFYQQSATGFVGGSNVAAYQRLDIRLAKRFEQANAEPQVALVVQNLLDDDYAEFQDRNAFDRRVYLTLALHFL